MLDLCSGALFMLLFLFFSSISLMGIFFFVNLGVDILPLLLNTADI